MTVNNRQLTTALLTSATATYYTSPTPNRTIIRNVTVTNLSASNATVSLWFGSGATATSANQLYYNYPIVSGATTALAAAQGHVLEVGGTIQAVASVPSVLSFIVSGVQVS